MRKTLLSSLVLAGAACFGLAPNGQAQDVVANNQVPGSLLIYPVFDNTRGALTLMTVTNTSATTGIFAHFVYINAANCQETDRSHYLSPLDTKTVNTRNDNPNVSKGYLFVFAKQAISPTVEGPNAVKFDHLIGQEWVFDPTFDLFSLNPFTFRAGDGVVAELANTDVNPVNGKRDLNGHEYNYVPNVLEFPRYFAQFPGILQSELVLINLTGGGQFIAQADILLYDNNENQFSSAISWFCWTRVPLSTTGNPTGISAFFDEAFLINTSNNVEAAQAFGVVSGWFTVDGSTANSTQTQLNDPAVLGVLLDSFVGAAPRTAVLPYGEGINRNGRLLSHSLFGD